LNQVRTVFFLRICKPDNLRIDQSVCDPSDRKQAQVDFLTISLSDTILKGKVSSLKLYCIV